MARFAIGDRVLYSAGDRKRVGTVKLRDDLGNTFVRFDRAVDDGQHELLITEAWSIERWLTPHVDEFPIAADKDPWRESEPGLTHPNGDDSCGVSVPSELVPHRYARPSCNRARTHIGHHVARDTVFAVIARWPQEAAKLGGELVGPSPYLRAERKASTRTRREPRDGDEVIVANNCRLSAPMGKRGVIRSAGKDGFMACGVWWTKSQFGNDVVLESEWEAAQKIGNSAAAGDVFVIPAGASIQTHTLGGKSGDRVQIGTVIGTAIDDGEKGQLVAIAVGAKPIPPAHIDGDLGGPAPRYEFTDIFVAKVALAQFRADNAFELSRVADEGRGGIGKDEAFRRMVWATTETTRARYFDDAADLLKSAKEMP